MTGPSLAAVQSGSWSSFRAPRPLLAATLGVALGFGHPLLAAQAPGDTLRIADAIALARDGSPMLAAARSAAVALESRVDRKSVV